VLWRGFANWQCVHKWRAAAVRGEVNHYRGTDYQGIDNAMPDIVGIDTYTEDMILIKPFGSMGIAYSVFRFSEGTITDAPRFQALIAGSLVYDTRKVDDYPDPFLPYVTFGIEFIGADNSTPANLDYGPNNTVSTWFGTAKITGNQLACDGSGHVTMPGSTTAMQFGTGLWSIECRFTPSTVGAGIRSILSKGLLSPELCFYLYQVRECRQTHAIQQRHRRRYI